MAIEIDTHLLKKWPLPQPARDGDKEERGHVLIVAGSPEIPGAAVLAGMAALRAGAGKLTVVAPATIAMQVALQLPEARVIKIPTAIADLCASTWLPNQIDAVLVGPGMEKEGIDAVVKTVLQTYRDKKILLDAAAMKAIVHVAGSRNILLTPHAGEMADLLDCAKREVLANAEQIAVTAAKKWGVVIALKGSETRIALPDARVWIHRGGDIGLATSGSGDVLAGLIVGFLAQGAALEQGAAWGIVCHALAGEAAARELGCTLGYLAGEISIHVPRIVAALQGKGNQP